VGSQSYRLQRLVESVVPMQKLMRGGNKQVNDKEGKNIIGNLAQNVRRLQKKFEHGGRLNVEQNAKQRRRCCISILHTMVCHPGPQSGYEKLLENVRSVGWHLTSTFIIGIVLNRIIL